MHSLDQRARAYIAKLPPAVEGNGGHVATFNVASALVRGFALDEASAFSLLVEWNESKAFPPWTDADLLHKLRSAAASLHRPLGYLRTDGQQPRTQCFSAPAVVPVSRPPPQPKWPAPDYDLIKEALRSGQSLEEMRCASPVPVDGLKTADVLPVLFPGNPLITVGKSSREFCTRPQVDCLPWADQCSLIVPSPCTKPEGLTLEGKPSQHCKEMVGPRQYLVCETDFKHEGASGELLAHAKQEHGLEPPDVAASILNFLTQFLPRLALVVSSGGKSLHGFFNVSDMTSPEDPDGAQLYAFMQSAALIGCDRAGWNRAQFSRMPGGTRHDADGNAICPQTILFFNPTQCLAQ